MRGEPETCTPALYRRRDFVDVVAYYAKPDVLGILFDHTAESRLGRSGHHVCFVEDDELEPRRVERPRLREVFNLLTNHIDPAVIGGVQL